MSPIFLHVYFALVALVSTFGGYSMLKGELEFRRKWNEWTGHWWLYALWLVVYSWVVYVAVTANFPV